MQGARSGGQEARLEAFEAGDYQGQKSFRIETPTAVYLYHRSGAGFAALIDAGGNDWIGYRPGGGSAGEYRGIPNVRPAGFHPGYTESTSRIAQQDAHHVRIVSERLDGSWGCTWDIGAASATLTLTGGGPSDDRPSRTGSEAPAPYWVLYEGTPGGVLRPEEDSLVLSSGEVRRLSESWDEPLPAPEWIAFRSVQADRSLFLLHHEADDVTDCYWPMQGNMTVFGFGRTGHGEKLRPLMTRLPARFTIGLVKSLDVEEIRRAVEDRRREAAALL
jgi:hypothetical protein